MIPPIKYYYKRTEKHIKLVKKWYKRLSNKFDTIPKVNIEFHDFSKYEHPELEPYMYMTWQKYCESKNILYIKRPESEQRIAEATFHHVKINPHHPEYWDDTFTFDKYLEKTKVFAEFMPKTYLMEMVADWLAMSNEFKTDPVEWATKAMKTRWIFSFEQIALISEMLKIY